MKFTAKGYEYETDKFGLVHQLNPDPYVYDPAYSATYDTPEYTRKAELLQALRLGFVIAAHGCVPGSILDVGYGAGNFMNFAKKIIPTVYGKDVTGVPVPEGCKYVDSYVCAGVICFWDVLEHIPDLSFVEHLSCETICISLPYCHIHKANGVEWFKNDYPHLKPNEHLHHGDEYAWSYFMDSVGWKTVAISKHEDIVRNRGEQWNILSMAFKRK